MRDDMERSVLYSALILAGYFRAPAAADRGVTVPAGLRPQAAKRLDQRRSSHGARGEGQ